MPESEETRATDAAEIKQPDAMERVVQEAIEEWATIHGGPRPDDVPLAHYITAKVRHALTGWRTDPEAAAALRQPREGADDRTDDELRADIEADRHDHCRRLLEASSARAESYRDALRPFIENHGSFHPDFWLAGRRGKGERCAPCDLCAAVEALEAENG